MAEPTSSARMGHCFCGHLVLSFNPLEYWQAPVNSDADYLTKEKDKQRITIKQRVPTFFEFRSRKNRFSSPSSLDNRFQLSIRYWGKQPKLPTRVSPAKTTTRECLGRVPLGQGSNIVAFRIEKRFTNSEIQ